MKQTNACPKCGSKDLIANAKAMDRQGWDLVIATFRDPNAVFFRGKQASSISSLVCGECGFIELYADDPAALKLANE